MPPAPVVIPASSKSRGFHDGDEFIDVIDASAPSSTSISNISSNDDDSQHSLTLPLHADDNNKEMTNNHQQPAATAAESTSADAGIYIYIYIYIYIFI